MICAREIDGESCKIIENTAEERRVTKNTYLQFGLINRPAHAARLPGDSIPARGCY